MNYILLIILLVANSCLFCQKIDNSLETIQLPKKYDPYKTFKKSKSKKPIKEDKIILFYQAIIQKHGETFVMDSTLNPTGIVKFPKLLYHFQDGIKVLLVGAAYDDKILKGENLKCVSFYIDSMPSIGDTAKFEFLILSHFSSRHNRSLNPTVYFSEKLLAGENQNILNQDNLVFHGNLSQASPNDTTPVISNVTFIVDTKSKNYKWIHLVNNVERKEMGYILPMNLNIDSIIQLNSNMPSKKVEYQAELKVLFDYNLSILNEKEIALLDVFIEKSKNKPVSAKIYLQGFADRNGNLQHNIVLAGKRMEIVYEYLIKNGIEEKQIVKKIPAIGNIADEEENRSCVLEIY